MVDAARAAGVRKFVFSGVIHPSISAMVNHRAKVPVAEALYTSGMAFTVLQPAAFMQNIERTWDEIVAHGRLAMPYSASSKMCWVDYRDVAAAASSRLLLLQGARRSSVGSHSSWRMAMPLPAVS